MTKRLPIATRGGCGSVGRGVQGVDKDAITLVFKAELIERYSGNPLALKIIATTIQEFFGF